MGFCPGEVGFLALVVFLIMRFQLLRFGVFCYHQLVISFSDFVRLIMEFTWSRCPSHTGTDPTPTGESHGQADHNDK
jgi:hypothetical protein